VINALPGEHGSGTKRNRRGAALPTGRALPVVLPGHRPAGIPRNSVLFVGALTLIGGLSLTYQLGAEMLNFGAFIAFMGVNLAAFNHLRARTEERRWGLVLPLLGFLVCFYLWLSLRLPAKLAGGAWLGAGLVYGAVKTRGFRRRQVSFELPPE
jgi:hypothetical protein